MTALPEPVMERLPIIVGGIEACESPIERLLASALWSVAPDFCDDGWCVIKPQHEIDTNQGRYRADFFIGALIRGHLVSMVVECDGHDFHERTKEQAAADKARDRALQRRGFNVIRFTGSEIHNYPRSCAQETFATMSALVSGREG